ncbi:hypothetical protein GOBAR_DD08402 [Gossypium barbadense]|nr:hypothetical protein GOBAR_DD08402 [Gossypium barbadense]
MDVWLGRGAILAVGRVRWFDWAGRNGRLMGRGGAVAAVKMGGLVGVDGDKGWNGKTMLTSIYHGRWFLRCAVASTYHVFLGGLFGVVVLKMVKERKRNSSVEGEGK